MLCQHQASRASGHVILTVLPTPTLTCLVSAFSVTTERLNANWKNIYVILGYHIACPLCFILIFLTYLVPSAAFFLPQCLIYHLPAPLPPLILLHTNNLSSSLSVLMWGVNAKHQLLPFASTDVAGPAEFLQHSVFLFQNPVSAVYFVVCRPTDAEVNF